MGLYPLVIQSLAELEADIPDNYVAHTLKNVEPLPPVGWHNFWSELVWFHVAALTLTPIIGIVGAIYTPLCWQTALFSVFYYYYTALGAFLKSLFLLGLF